MDGIEVEEEQSSLPLGPMDSVRFFQGSSVRVVAYNLLVLRGLVGKGGVEEVMKAFRG